MSVYADIILDIVPEIEDKTSTSGCNERLF
jgi:hypothetical protein